MLKNLFAAAAFFVFSAPVLMAQAPAPQAPIPAISSKVPASFADLVATLSPAVVNISTTQKTKNNVAAGVPFALPEGQQFDQFRELFKQFGLTPQSGDQPAPTPRETFSLGSGFIIDESGYVVTNTHVVDEATRIQIILQDNTKIDAKLVGRDPKTDLAVLKVESKKPLPYVKFGDSDAARVGDWVLAIGNPFGLGGTVTAGIISARARDIHAGSYDDFIQTDAAINRGNSGGPLFNMAGEVIGVNSAIFSPTGGNIGIGFSIPANMVKPVVKQLRERGKVERGWLGVRIQEVNDEVANSLGLKSAGGALVLDMTPGSPAIPAGVKPGDVIMKFDGKDVTQLRSLPRIVADTPIGKKTTLVVWRNSKMVSLSITIAAMPADDKIAGSQLPSAPQTTGPQKLGESVLGMQMAELTPAIRVQNKIPKGTQGVLVTNAGSGQAASRGLQNNDIILQVNDVLTPSVKDLATAVQSARASGKDYVLLRGLRGNEFFFATVPLK